MKKPLLLLCTLLTFYSNFSQEKKLTDAYTEYFKLPRESLFLHTNKTTYVMGEEIWFSAYARDRHSDLSSKVTTNIYVGIYDDKGKQIDKKLFLGKEGIAAGNIAIDSTYASGEYYLKASTNWMKNFREDDSFIQKILVINPNSELIKKQKVSEKEYDIQFLPEGGHIVAETMSVIGVKAINDKGKGTRSNGVITDSNGVEVASFKTNFLGFDKFTFFPEKGQTYTAKIILENGKEVEQILPKVEDIGFSMRVNNLKEDNVYISISTNEDTYNLYRNQEFKLFLHRDGRAQIIPITINRLERRVVIDKAGLFQGVNIATLFNSKDQPILERMFFHDQKQRHSISVQETFRKGDTIAYKVAFDQKNLKINTSISVLPTQTASYSPNHNILSAFYLKPYLQGFIENPKYYFNNVTKKKKYELDVLLLTQGWSRYSWDKVMNFPPKATYDFENGLTINGYLNTSLSKVKSLILYPTKLNNSTFVEYDKQGKFHLKNYFPVLGENLTFSYITRKGKTKKPGMAVSILGKIQEDVLSIPEEQNLISYYTTNTITDQIFGEETEVLDEIVIKAQLEKAKRKEYLLPFRGKLYNIDRKMAETYIDLSQFLNNHGFVVDPNPTVLGGTLIRHNFPRRGPVVVFLNNVQMRDFEPFATRPMDEFEDIYIDDTPNANILSVGGQPATFVVVIKLFTRRTSLWDLEDKAIANSIPIDYGFEPVKKFYTPKYIDYSLKSFKDYGVVHWEPNLIVENGSGMIETVNTGLDEIDFHIEGIASDGSFFSEVIRISQAEK